MFSVSRNIERPEADLIEQLRQVPTGVISDVSTVQSVMDRSIRPVRPGLRMVGPAVTVECPPGDNLACHVALDMIEPGDVLIIAGGGQADVAFIGELMCRRIEVQEGAGVVVDGAVRDVADLRQLDLPVFARHVSPVGPAKAQGGAINAPVVCGGLRVCAGDVVVADDDGVCVIPRNSLSEVVVAARAKLQREEEIRQRILAGESTVDILDLAQVAEDAGMKL